LSLQGIFTRTVIRYFKNGEKTAQFYNSSHPKKKRDEQSAWMTGLKRNLTGEVQVICLRQSLWRWTSRCRRLPTTSGRWSWRK
jgi:hypothetical protein